MSAPLSQELFFNVHRGIALKGKYTSSDGLGVHWSADHTVAKSFARGNLVGLKGTMEGNTHGVIYHGTVPISGVETDTKTLKDKDVYTPENTHGYKVEKEVPLKKGTKVMVEGITTMNKKSYRERHRRYTPPREMTA